jgi:UDPglucose 6-dehydrogenase
MKLSIFGTGYVGLVTGTGFANLGHDVVCVDIDEEKIERLNNGELPIFEPGLSDLFSLNLKSGRLKFTTDPQPAVASAEVIFICVDTPSDPEGRADLSAVKTVARTIGEHLNDYKVIVNKSTVPVGTATVVRDIVASSRPADIDFGVASNPEFLREGQAVKDFEVPDRIVIGADNERALQVMVSLYKSIARTGRPIMETSIATAELVKYAANAMLASRISFMNQLSHLCEKTGADIKAVAKGIGLDSRIGSRFLHAGLGYGGSCFPKDVKALAATLKTHGCDADFFDAVDRINERQKLVAVDKLASVLPLKGATVAVWGLSFKPKTDDIREAPALEIISKLLASGAVVHAYDPVAVNNARAVQADVAYFDNPYETIRDCDALVVATEWDEFRNLDLRAVKVLLRQPIVVDGRNIYDPVEMAEMGFTYLSVGR